MSLAANLSVETEGQGSSHADEAFLEKGILRNKRTFEAVFDRIYEKYDREFHEDEDGGAVIDLCGEHSESQINCLFGNENTRLGCKYQPILIPDDTESDSEDLDLAAQLHERVLKVKREIDWDNEELRLREQRRREKESKECDSDSSENSESEYPHTRPANGKRRGSRVRSDVRKLKVGKPSISASYMYFRDDESLVSLPIDPCVPDEEDGRTHFNTHSEPREERDSTSKQCSSSEHGLDQLDSSRYDATSETEATCDATTIVISGTTSAESGHDEPRQPVREPLHSSEQRCCSRTCSLESGCSTTPLLPSVDLGNVQVREERPNSPSVPLKKMTCDGAELKSKEATQRDRDPFVPVSGSNLVSDVQVKSEPESESESHVESESELDEFPSESDSEVVFDEQELLSGYESGHVEEQSKRICTRSQCARTLPVSPISLPQPTKASEDTLPGTISEDLPTETSDTPFLMDGRRISTSTPVTVKMKSLQLSLTKTPVRSPLKETLTSSSASQSTDSTLNASPKTPTPAPSAGYMTSHDVMDDVQIHSPKEQLSFGELTSDAELSSCSDQEAHGRVTSTVIHRSLRDIHEQPSGHVINTTALTPLKSVLSSSHMTNTVNNASPRSVPLTGHMTNTTPPRSEPTAGHMTNTVDIDMISDAELSSSSSQDAPSHISSTVVHRSLKVIHVQPSGHVTNTAALIPPQSIQPSSHITDSVNNAPPRSEPSAGHITNTVVISSDAELSSSSDGDAPGQIISTVVHKSTKASQPSGHMTSTAPPISLLLTSHMTKSNLSCTMAPNKEIPSTSHMTRQSFDHTPTKELLKKTNASTNHMPLARLGRRSSSVDHMTSPKAHTPPRRSTVDLSDSTHSWSEPRKRGRKSRHMTKSSGTYMYKPSSTSQSGDSTLRYHLTKALRPVKSMSASHMTKSTVHTCSSSNTPLLSSHMTKHNRPMKSLSGSHMTDNTDHTPPKTLSSSSGQVKDSTGYSRPIKSSSAGHVIVPALKSEAQTQTDNNSLSGDSTIEVNVTSSSRDSASERSQQPSQMQVPQRLSPVKDKERIDTTFLQKGSVAVCQEGRVDPVSRDGNTDKVILSPRRSHEGDCYRHHFSSPSQNFSSCCCYHQCNQPSCCSRSTLTPTKRQSPSESHTQTTPTHITHSQTSNAIQQDKNNHNFCASCQSSPSPGRQVDHTHHNTCMSIPCPAHFSPSCCQGHMTCHTSTCPSHSPKSSPPRDPRVRREPHQSAMSSSPVHPYLQSRENSTHNIPCSHSHNLNPREHHLSITSSFDAPYPTGRTQQEMHTHSNMSSCPSTQNTHLEGEYSPSCPSQFSECSLPNHMQREDQLPLNSAHTISPCPVHSSCRDATPPLHVPPSPSHNVSTRIRHTSPHSHTQERSHTHRITSNPSHIDHSSRIQSHTTSNPSISLRTHSLEEGCHLHPTPSHSINHGREMTRCCSSHSSPPVSPNKVPFHGRHAESSPAISSDDYPYGDSCTSGSLSCVHVHSGIKPSNYSPQHGENHTQCRQAGPSHSCIATKCTSFNERGGSHSVQSYPAHFPLPSHSYNCEHTSYSSAHGVSHTCNTSPNSSQDVVQGVSHTHTNQSCPSHSPNQRNTINSPYSQQYTGSHTHTVQPCPSHSASPSPNHNISNVQVHNDNHPHTKQSCPSHITTNCSYHSPLRPGSSRQFVPHTPPSHHSRAVKRVREEGREACCSTQLLFPPPKRPCH